MYDSLSKFRTLLEESEKGIRAIHLTKYWGSLEHRKEAYKRAYPNLTLNDQDFFREMILKEEDYSKVIQRLDILSTLNKEIQAEIRQQEHSRLLGSFRQERTNKLNSTDWTMLPDVDLDKKLREDYRKYRKYLRKLPELYRLKIVDELKILSFDEYVDSYLYRIDIEKIK